MSLLPCSSGRIALASAALTLLVSFPTFAVEAPVGSHHPAPDVDLRRTALATGTPVDPQALRAAAPAAQSAALAEFERSVPGLQVRWSALTGSPNRIYSTRGALTGPGRQQPEARVRFGLAPLR